MASSYHFFTEIANINLHYRQLGECLDRTESEVQRKLNRNAVGPRGQ